MSRHEFAFYMPDATEFLCIHLQKKSFTLKDSHLYHRITNVIRLVPDETFIIFDQFHHAHCTLNSIVKKNVIDATILDFQKNKEIKPHITFLLPILKREAFHDAIYSLTELGTSLIQPVITANVQRKWGQAREHERLLRIIHTAAEQSKNFSFPPLEQPLSFEEYIEKMKFVESINIYFDPHGFPLLQVIQDAINKNKKKIVLAVGPEAGLTSSEKKLLSNHNFTVCALTPTTLRAHQAAAVAIGAYRSLLKTDKILLISIFLLRHYIINNIIGFFIAS